MSGHLRVKDLIEILKTFDENLPLVCTNVGKDHQYSIKRMDIELIVCAYFGNDLEADKHYREYEKKFLNIGSC